MTMRMTKGMAACLLLIWSVWAGANCVNLNGRSYCAAPGGMALLHRGQAYCSAGQCVIDEFGNLFCSPYPGGGAVRAGGSFFAGPGQCLVSRDGNAYCARLAQGNCQQAANGEVQCDGGWVREPAVRPALCN